MSLSPHIGTRFVHQRREIGRWVVEWQGWEGIPFEVQSYERARQPDSIAMRKYAPPFYTRDWAEAKAEFDKRVDEITLAACADALGLKEE